MTFIDIESVPQENPATLGAPPELYWNRFAHKVEGEIPEFLKHYRDNAALLAEFGKIVCVSVGKIKDGEILIKTFASRYENKILEKLSYEIDGSQVQLCAHNGYEFDFPFLFRRYQINGISVPKPINVNHLKKWEWPLFDTMTM